MKYNLNDKPGIFPMFMYGLQWWIVSIPCVVIMGIIVAQLHSTDASGQIFYMQKLFGVMGIAMTAQVLWGHRLPIIIGPASVLLIGILAAISVGTAAIYTAIFVCGIFIALLAFCGLLSHLQAIFTPRIIIVILCLIAFTLAPVILQLIFTNTGSASFQLFFALLLAFGMILANRLLRGIWKSTVVLCGILAGSFIYYSIEGFPLLPSLIPLPATETHFWLWPLHFEGGVILSFFFCFIALIVNELGSIQAVGQMIGADNMEKRTTRGVGFIGLSNILSGVCGIIGPVDYSMSPGIIAATGCASRYTLIPAGLGLVICAFFPGFIQILNCIPGVVMGSVLLYLMSSQLSAGLQMLSRSKAVSDFNSGIIIGFPLMVALMLAFVPHEVIDRIPAFIRPIVGNGFVMGVIFVLLLEHIILKSPKQEKG